MPAASGCKMGNSPYRFFDRFAIGSSELPVGCPMRIKGKLPIEIVVKTDERHHTSVRKPRTHAYRRANAALVSARAVAVIRPAPSVISLPAFLCTLSGKRQLHAYRYRSGYPNPDYFRSRRSGGQLLNRRICAGAVPIATEEVFSYFRRRTLVSRGKRSFRCDATSSIHFPA